eukprot:GHVU01117226.1.p3 GENE.GHVU01117226.1~~GHVU01117226.1.p3  ORF type:complete len:114 (-),score=16.73 GHVU01117226.1:805-1146(-)
MMPPPPSCAALLLAPCWCVHRPGIEIRMRCIEGDRGVEGRECVRPPAFASQSEPRQQHGKPQSEHETAFERAAEKAAERAAERAAYDNDPHWGNSGAGNGWARQRCTHTETAV